MEVCIRIEHFFFQNRERSLFFWCFNERHYCLRMICLITMASKMRLERLERLERDWGHTWGLEQWFTLSIRTSGHQSSVIFTHQSILAHIYGFLLSHVSRPISAAEDFMKSHSPLFKSILLAVFGAGTTTPPRPAALKLLSQHRCILRVDMLTSCRLRGVLHRGLRAGLPEGHRARGSDGFGCGDQILWACEEVQRKKHQPVFPTGWEVLQVQPEVDEMVSGSCLFSFIFWNPSSQFLSLVTNWGSVVCVCRVFIVAVLGLLVTWLVLDTSKRPEQLISFGGICLFILLLFLLSAHKTAVSVPPAEYVELPWRQPFRNTQRCYCRALSGCFCWDLGYHLPLCPCHL